MLDAKRGRGCLILQWLATAHPLAELCAWGAEHPSCSQEHTYLLICRAKIPLYGCLERVSPFQRCIQPQVFTAYRQRCHFEGQFHFVELFSALQLHLLEHLLVLQGCWELLKPSLWVQRSSSWVFLFDKPVNNQAASGNWMLTQCSLVQKVCSGSSSIMCDLSAQHWLRYYFFYSWLWVQHTYFTDI